MSGKKAICSRFSRFKRWAGQPFVFYAEASKSRGTSGANLRTNHLELLVLTKLEKIVEVFEDEQDAIDSFFPDRSVKHYDILKFVESLHIKT
jgi:hypothetical protein